MLSECRYTCNVLIQVSHRRNAKLVALEIFLEFPSTTELLVRCVNSSYVKRTR